MGERTGMLLRRPSLGGWLTMLNGVLWVVFVLVARNGGVPDAVGVAVSLTLSIPFSFPLPCALVGSSIGGILVGCALAGINLFAWGYGLAWLWHHVFRRHPLRLLVAVVAAVAVLFVVARMLTA